MLTDTTHVKHRGCAVRGCGACRGLLVDLGAERGGSVTVTRILAAVAGVLDVTDLLVAAVGFVGAAVAVFWPELQARQRRFRFTKMIRRELQEIGPVSTGIDPDAPWWA